MEKDISFSGVNRSESRFKGKGKLEKKSTSVTWEVEPGVTAKFREITISYDELKDNTFVKFSNNGRNQNLLTEEVLARLKSLDTQQYYPAIGLQHEDGKIELLDGSCRRAYVLSKKGKIATFKIMVTKDDLSVSSAKRFAKDLRSSLEQHLFEIGEQAEISKNEGKTQRVIAEELGHSQRKINLSLKTRVIPEETMKLFPVINELQWTDYLRLIAISDSLPIEISFEDNESIDVDVIIKKLEELAVGNQPVKTKPRNKNQAVTTPLINFDKSTRKAVEMKTANRVVEYKFKRLSVRGNQFIEERIKEMLSELEEIEDGVANKGETEK